MSALTTHYTNRESAPRWLSDADRAGALCCWGGGAGSSRGPPPTQQVDLLLGGGQKVRRVKIQAIFKKVRKKTERFINLEVFLLSDFWRLS